MGREREKELTHNNNNNNNIHFPPPPPPLPPLLIELRNACVFVARCYVVVVERARWRMMERREFGNGVPFEIVSLSLFAFTAALVPPPPAPFLPAPRFSL